MDPHSQVEWETTFVGLGDQCRPIVCKDYMGFQGQILGFLARLFCHFVDRGLHSEIEHRFGDPMLAFQIM